MNILRVKSIMNRDPSARTCNRTRVLRDQQIKLVQTVSQSKFRVIFSIMKNFGKVHSFYEDSCANLVSFKIVVLSIQIKTKSTTILNEMRFAQLFFKKEKTLGQKFFFHLLGELKEPNCPLEIN